MRTGWLFCLAAALLAGCARPAARPETAAVIAPPGPPKATVRTLSVVALADDTWQKVPRFEARIAAVIGDASAHLAARFGLALELRRIAPWDPPPGDSAALLAELERRDPAPAADLVIAFTARLPPRRVRMPDLARSRYAGRSVVLHGLGRYFEMPDARHAAEVRALLHAVGRVFGALSDCGEGVMADRPADRIVDPAAWRWGATNGALFEAHVAMPLRGPAGLDGAGGQGAQGGRVGAEAAAAARQALAAPGPDLRCDPVALDERRALLAAVMTAERGANEAAEGAGALLADDAEGLTQHEADRAAIERAEAALAADSAAVDPAATATTATAVFTTCAPIADRDPALAARCAGRAAEILGRHDDAIRYLRAWLSHHPGDEEALLRLAREVGRDGDDAAARALLEQAVAEHPEFDAARLNLGIARARLGDYPGARAAWEALLARDPAHAEARRLLDQLPD